MDNKTLKAYAENAEKFSQNWLSQAEPEDVYALLQHYFQPGKSTADIGCGNGRDVAWLNQHGYPTEGYDSSIELLAIAKKLFPKFNFNLALLPELQEVTKKYDNVICETVIMHLPATQISTAILNLKRILHPQGILYLSWRISSPANQRSNDGRLYSVFDSKLILDQFKENRVLYWSEINSASSGHQVGRLVASI